MSGDSSTVFVGNVPFDVTDSQLHDLFSTVGPVSSLRILNDRDTGKPRGFGFVSYADRETAASAVRNLNNYELNNRMLKVNFADQEQEKRMGGGGGGGGERGGGDRGNEGGGGKSNNSSSSSTSSSSSSSPLSFVGSSAVPNPFLSPSPSLPYNPSDITSLLRTLSRDQLLEILTEMKRFCSSNPEGAKQLLLDTPQLAHALLQIELLFGLVSVDEAKRMELERRPIGMPSHAPLPPPSLPPITSGGALPPPPPPASYASLPLPVPLPYSSPAPMSLPPPPPPSSHHTGMSHAYPPPPHATPPPLSHTHIPPPPLASAPTASSHISPFASIPSFSGPHPILPPGAPEPEFFTKLPPQEQQVLRELLRLSPDQIKQMPMHVQQQVYSILQQMGMTR